jgi:hypothetical protein
MKKIVLILLVVLSSATFAADISPEVKADLDGVVEALTQQINDPEGSNSASLVMVQLEDFSGRTLAQRKVIAEAVIAHEVIFDEPAGRWTEAKTEASKFLKDAEKREIARKPLPSDESDFDKEIALSEVIFPYGAPFDNISANNDSEGIILDLLRQYARGNKEDPQLLMGVMDLVEDSTSQTSKMDLDYGFRIAVALWVKDHATDRYRREGEKRAEKKADLFLTNARKSDKAEAELEKISQNFRDAVASGKEGKIKGAAKKIEKAILKKDGPTSTISAVHGKTDRGDAALRRQFQELYLVAANTQNKMDPESPALDEFMEFLENIATNSRMGEGFPVATWAGGMKLERPAKPKKVEPAPIIAKVDKPVEKSVEKPIEKPIEKPVKTSAPALAPPTEVSFDTVGMPPSPEEKYGGETPPPVEENPPVLVAEEVSPEVTSTETIEVAVTEILPEAVATEVAEAPPEVTPPVGEAPVEEVLLAAEEMVEETPPVVEEAAVSELTPTEYSVADFRRLDLSSKSAAIDTIAARDTWSDADYEILFLSLGLQDDPNDEVAAKTWETICGRYRNIQEEREIILAKVQELRNQNNRKFSSRRADFLLEYLKTL